MFDSWEIIDFSGEKSKSKITRKKSNGETYDSVYSWTADYERNIYFFLLGGGAGDTSRDYALMWNKSIH